MFGYLMSNYDQKIYEEELADFLPDKIIDVHNHIWKKEFTSGAKKHDGLVTWTNLVANECTIEDLVASYHTLFPKSVTIPVVMGNPEADLEKTNAYTKECSEKYGFKSLYCTRYDTPAGEIENALTKEGFSGIKPYLNNSPSYIPPDEIRIYDFLPKEHLEILNRLGSAVILHIARPKRLRDMVNIRQLMEIEELYPNIRLIVAHIGRAYSPEDLGDAFDILKNTKNMVFDFSANTLSKAMTECIKAVGIKRLVFGSDMPITKMRMYRITEQGVYYNVVPRGLYGDVSGDSHMRETDKPDITCFMYEEILAFKKTGVELQLTKEEICDVFYNNAARIFNI